MSPSPRARHLVFVDDGEAETEPLEEGERDAEADDDALLLAEPEALGLAVALGLAEVDAEAEGLFVGLALALVLAEPLTDADMLGEALVEPDPEIVFVLDGLGLGDAVVEAV